MAVKIIGTVTTLPHTVPYQNEQLALDQWIDSMLTRHDDCGSLWCYQHWVTDVETMYRRHGLPVPIKGSLPWKEYSLVYVNELTHMLEAAA